MWSPECIRKISSSLCYHHQYEGYHISKCKKHNIHKSYLIRKTSFCRLDQLSTHESRLLCSHFFRGQPWLILHKTQMNCVSASPRCTLNPVTSFCPFPYLLYSRPLVLLHVSPTSVTSGLTQQSDLNIYLSTLSYHETYIPWLQSLHSQQTVHFTAVSRLLATLSAVRSWTITTLRSSGRRPTQVL